MGNKVIEGLSKLTSSYKEVASDILLINFTVVNAYIIGNSNNYILVDTGLENSADYILQTIDTEFDNNSKPKSIILTHGHFDHIGSVIKLSDYWNVPVYIHQLEMPYVTGQKDYPIADPTVEKGMVAKISPTFPHTNIDLNSKAVALPADGSIPDMPSWKWIHTPGHTEGHISLFRELDRALIVGDAFSTTKQESLWAVVTHKKQMNGPPKYLTTDWKAAENSVKVLRDLAPEIALPSHGQPMKGDELMTELTKLIDNFNEIAKPKKGKFVD